MSNYSFLSFTTVRLDFNIPQLWFELLNISYKDIFLYYKI